MNTSRVRKRGIFLSVSRIDRKSVVEIWIYNRSKVGLSVYDPSKFEIVELLSNSVRSKKSGSDKFNVSFGACYKLWKENEELRCRGTEKRLELKLTTAEKVNAYIKKENNRPQVTREAIRRKKRKTS